jgi:DNA-binding response OmpR family regulator
VYVKILVIEDQVKFADSLKRGLVQKGYVVDVINDGKTGLDTLEINHGDYDLVLLDVMLPRMSGIDICRAVRSQNIAIPIIMLTSRDGTTDKITGLDSGADDYIVKPFDFSELLARIKTILRRPTIVYLAKLESGGLLLDPNEQMVYCEGKLVPLTGKEYAILECLMRNKGSVVTREIIVSRVWDDSFDAFSNVINVHIANIKKKIPSKSDANRIETVRGKGYRFAK